LNRYGDNDYSDGGYARDLQNFRIRGYLSAGNLQRVNQLIDEAKKDDDSLYSLYLEAAITGSIMLCDDKQAKRFLLAGKEEVFFKHLCCSAANTYINSNRLDQAIQLYKGIDSVDAIKALGVCLVEHCIKMGNLTMVIGHIKEAKDEHHPDLLQHALICYVQSDSVSIQTLTELLQINPEALNANLKLILPLCINQGKHRGVVEHFLPQVFKDTKGIQWVQHANIWASPSVPRTVDNAISVTPDLQQEQKADTFLQGPSQ
jgi:tetratricopeptide (TPR) repeat protein